MTALPSNTLTNRLALLQPALLLLATLMLFNETAAGMVAIWWRSETFTHAFLVPPISLWLIWRRRAFVQGLTPKPMPWLLVPMAAVCLLWLLGELATVNAASQFALVTLIVLSVPALLGWAITRELLFPLAFLYFAVPFGEFLVPQFMEWTADFTVAALQATGIPVYREGLEFVIPSGSWSVVQACSGVRYLIASFMVGTLFAYLNYRSMTRRLMFIAVSIAVPIIANWFRAYMIVMIGHLSDNELAAGVDHIIYGWVFFGIVIGLMFVVGARWSEPEDTAVPARAALQPVPAHAPIAGWGVAAMVLLMLATTQWVLWRLDQGEANRPVSLDLPVSLAGGWAAQDVAGPSWQPGFRNPSAQASRTFTNGDNSVWLWVGYFRDQGEARKLVTSVNSLVTEEDKQWAQVSRSRQTVALPDAPLTVRVGDLRQATPLDGAPAGRLRVWQVYWTGTSLTASDARAKLQQALNRLRGKSDDGAVLLMATPLTDASDATLDSFARTQMGALVEWLEATRDGR